MGTLFNQLERNPRDIDTADIHAVYSWLVNIRENPDENPRGGPHEDMLEHGPDLMSGATLMLEVMKYLQLKRTGDLMVRDGDVRDEQLHGMGVILLEIAASLKDIAAKIKAYGG